VEDLRGCGADVGELPFEVFDEWLEAFEGDFELVLVVELGRVVAHRHVEQRDCRHDAAVVCCLLLCGNCCWWDAFNGRCAGFDVIVCCVMQVDEW